MAYAKVMMLEGADGFSFFFQETLLEQGLAQSVDRVRQANQAIELINQSNPLVSYDLVIIDLVESWEEGMQLGFWLKQHPLSCPIILIVPPDISSTSLMKAPFIAVPAPLSLNDFTERVREALASANDEPQAAKTAATSAKVGGNDRMSVQMRNDGEAEDPGTSKPSRWNGTASPKES